MAEINKFLLSHDMRVILVVFDRKAFELSGKLVDDIEEYIDEHSADEIRDAEYGGRYGNTRRERLERLESLHSAIMPDTYDEDEPEEDESESRIIYAEAAAPSFPDVSGMSLDEVLDSSEDTFQQRLFKLIDESGMDDVTVYKKANIDRKVFSRIRCKEDYKPKKKTAVAFAIALQLDMPTMLDLLSRAEIAFSPSNKFDLIITYFITNKVYDIYEINAALFKYGQPILGE